MYKTIGWKETAHVERARERERGVRISKTEFIHKKLISIQEVCKGQKPVL